MRYILCLFTALIFITGCNSVEVVATPTVSPAGKIEIQLGATEIELNKPLGWFAYSDETHLIISEERDPILAKRLLNGIVVNVWAQEIAPDAIRVPIAELLTRILHDAELDRSSHTTAPQSFNWDGYDTAYYLLNSGDGNITLVMILHTMSADFNDVVGLNISAPHAEIARLRQILPVLFDGMVLNDVVLSGETLDQSLPVVLTVPDYNQNPEAAIQASPGIAPTP